MALFWFVAGSAIQKMTNNQPKNRQAKEENYVQKENIVFLEEKKNGEGKYFIMSASVHPSQVTSARIQIQSRGPFLNNLFLIMDGDSNGGDASKHSTNTIFRCDNSLCD